MNKRTQHGVLCIYIYTHVFILCTYIHLCACEGHDAYVEAFINMHSQKGTTHHLAIDVQAAQLPEKGAAPTWVLLPASIPTSDLNGCLTPGGHPLNLVAPTTDHDVPMVRLQRGDGPCVFGLRGWHFVVSMSRLWVLRVQLLEIT